MIVRLRVCAVALICLAATIPAAAGTISVAWDAVSDPDVVGYRVFYDTTPGAFGNSVDVGAVTSTVLQSLADCTEYQVAVKALDDAGNQSNGFSNVVTGWSRPRVDSASVTQIEQGAQIELTLAGANFQPGASVTFSNPAISVDGVQVAGCHNIVVDLTVDGQAALGASDVTVVNPDSVYGRATALVSIVIDTTPPVITDIEASAVGATSATISWTTNEPADSRVLWRPVGQATFFETAVDPTLTTSHVLTLQGLSPDVPYEAQAESRDAAGNLTTSIEKASFQTQPSSFSYLRFEAESGALAAPIQTATGGGAFAETWIELPSGSADGSAQSPNGTAEFAFNVPHTATWQVWVRISGTDAGGDCWFETVDGQAFQSLLSSGTGQWEWLPARSYALSAGQHTLRLGGAADVARADRLIVTDDPNFTPAEEPGDDTTPPNAVSGLAAVSGAGFNTLSWVNPTDAADLTIVVRYRTDGLYPTTPVDGLSAAEIPGASGSAGSYDHTGLVNGTTYSYAVFAVDPWGNVSLAATVAGTPLIVPPGNVSNLHRTDAE